MLALFHFLFAATRLQGLARAPFVLFCLVSAYQEFFFFYLFQFAGIVSIQNFVLPICGQLFKLI
jgi:hypothetical protein